MKDTFSIADKPVNVEALELVGIVLDVLKDRREKANVCIGGHDLWTEVSKVDARFKQYVNRCLFSFESSKF